MQLDHRLLDRHAYGLIDRALHDSDPSDLPVHVLAPAFMEHDTGRCPGLVALRELAADKRLELLATLQAECDAGEPPLFSALLECDADADALRAHLLDRLVFRRADHALQFRYYDPRVFVQLPEILDAGTLAALFGPIRRWTYFLSGAWHTEDKPVHAGSSFFHPGPTALARLAGLGIVNRVLALQGAPADAPGWRRAAGEIEALAQRAREEHGLTDREDIVNFALHGLRVHERFDRHPRVAALIAGLKEQDMSYSDATALLGDDDLAGIRSDLNACGDTAP